MASPAPAGAPRPSAFSISLGPAKPKPAARKPAPTFAAKRSAAHLDSDSDDEDHTRTSKVQLVTAFDATRGGAVDLAAAPASPTGPLVIPKLSNRNWREEAERRRGGGTGNTTKKAIYLPPEALARQNGISKEDLVEKDVVEQKYGLQTFERKPAAAAAAAVDAGSDGPPPPPRTEEELALASLLRGDAPAPSTLVLAPSAASTGNDWRAARAAAQNEDAAFKTDVASRPEMATLEDYAAVPVEEFGAALLRGMGWKEGDEVGRRRGAASKPRVVEKRPAFLGIGAKAKEEVPELGSWGKGDKKRRGRQDTTYVPVVMVDKRTGKVVDPAQVEAAAATGSGKEGREREKEGRGREYKRDRERSYDSSDRRRRDRGGHRDRDSGHRDRHGEQDRHGERRKDEGRRGDDRRRDRDRRDRR